MNEASNENQHRRTIRVSTGGTGRDVGEVGPDPKETEAIEQEKKRQIEREEELRRARGGEEAPA